MIVNVTKLPPVSPKNTRRASQIVLKKFDLWPLSLPISSFDIPLS